MGSVIHSILILFRLALGRVQEQVLFGSYFPCGGRKKRGATMKVHALHGVRGLIPRIGAYIHGISHVGFVTLVLYMTIGSRREALLGLQQVKYWL